MDLENVYRLSGDCFVFDIAMHDDISSHRYYLKKDRCLYRIINIDDLLVKLEQTNFELKKVTNIDGIKKELLDYDNKMIGIGENFALLTPFDDEVIERSLTRNK